MLQQLLERGRPARPPALSTSGADNSAAEPGSVAHYRLLARVDAGPDDECYTALPGRGPRVAHFLRRFPGCSLEAGAGSPGAPSLAEHRQRLANLLEQGRWPRRRALAVETVYEVGESEGVPYVVTQFHPGADLRQIARELLSGGQPLGWALRLLLLVEASDVLAAQHYAGYAHRGLSAARVRLTVGRGPALVLCAGYPLRRRGQLLSMADPDSPVLQLVDRWTLATAVLTAGTPRSGALAALAGELDPEQAQRVLWDQLAQRIHPHYEPLLRAYLDGDAASLPLPGSLKEILTSEEVERLWTVVGDLAARAD